MSSAINLLEWQLRLSLKAARRADRKIIAKCDSRVCAELGVCVGAYYFDNKCTGHHDERSY